MKNIEGVVESISKNETGIRVNGNWYNFSKYTPLSQKPKIGDNVKLILDASWIKRMEILPRANTKENSEEENPSRSFKKAHDPKLNSILDKDIRISRLAMLNTATEILKTHRRVIAASDVIQTAEELLEWVLEPAVSSTDPTVSHPTSREHEQNGSSNSEEFGDVPS
jgi:hypothetical protein